MQVAHMDVESKLVCQLCAKLFFFAVLAVAAEFVNLLGCLGTELVQYYCRKINYKVFELFEAFENKLLKSPQ